VHRALASLPTLAEVDHVRTSPRFKHLLLILVPLMLDGCVSSEVKQLIPITGGKTVAFSFGPKGAEPGRANGYEVQVAALLPGTDPKESFYQFAFTSPVGAQVKRVQIEDVSEELAAFPLIDDTTPKFTGNRWQADSAKIKAGDPHFAWALTIQTSMRVYRFTITDVAGVQTEMLHVVGYPDFIKSMMRKKWGEKY